VWFLFPYWHELEVGLLIQHNSNFRNEWLYAHDYHQDVIETSGHRIWHSKSTNTCPTQTIAQWSSPGGISHMVYMDVLHTGSTSLSTRHMGLLNQGGMDRWSTFTVFINCTSTLPEYLEHMSQATIHRTPPLRR